MCFRRSARERGWSHEAGLLTVVVYMMRLIQLRVLRWLGLGFSSRRRRLGCVLVTVFVVILILHFFTYRDREWVSCVFYLHFLFSVSWLCHFALVAFGALTLLVWRQEGHSARKKYGGWWRWALVSPDGVAPSRIVSLSASVNLPLHHKVQKFSPGTGSSG